MSDPIEFDPVDRIVAGAVGDPGRRTFLIQAGQGDAVLSVLVEKEQVAMLSARVLQLLAEIDAHYPESEESAAAGEEVPPLDEGPEPLFRARMLRLGFDPGRDLMVLELFEDVPEEGEEADIEEVDVGELGHVARLYATRSQMRAVAASGAEAVAAGRKTCPLCQLPVDPGGHDCPSKN